MRLTATDWPPALQSHEISNTFVDHVFIITCFIFAHYPGNRGEAKHGEAALAENRIRWVERQFWNIPDSVVSLCYYGIWDKFC